MSDRPTTPEDRARLAAAGWRSIALPPSPCPDCGFVSDSASHPHGAGSVVGGWMVCPGCATPRIVGADYRLRAVTLAEMRALTPAEVASLHFLRDVHRALPGYRGSDGAWPPTV